MSDTGQSAPAVEQGTAPQPEQSSRHRRLSDRQAFVESSGIAAWLRKVVSAFLASKITLVTIPVILISLITIIQATSIDHRHTLVLSRVDVPQAMVARGYNGRTLSQALDSAIRNIGEAVLAEKDYKKLAERLVLPEFDIGGTGISSSMLAHFMSLFRKKKGSEISLALICERPDCSLGRLYLSVLIENFDTDVKKRVLLPSVNETGNGHIGRIDELMAEAAMHILEQSDPFVVAANAFKAYSKSKRTDQAARDKAFLLATKTAQTLASDAPYAHSLIAQIYHLERRYDLAEHHFRKALTLDPTFGLAHHNWANMLAGRGYRAEALRHYNEALKRGVSDFMAPFSHAYAAVQMINLATNKPEREAALRRYHQARQVALRYHENIVRAQVHPALGYIHENLADALVRLDRPTEALVEYRSAVVANPNKALTHYLWGRLLSKMDNPISAQTVLERARKLYQKKNSPQTLAKVETLLARVLLQSKKETKALGVIADVIERPLPESIVRSAVTVAATAAAAGEHECLLWGLAVRFRSIAANVEALSSYLNRRSGPRPACRAHTMKRH